MICIEKGIAIEHEEVPYEPCLPSPCGPNSKCENYNGYAKCSCNENYSGRAPNCRPECIMNSECSFNTACINNKCSNPCHGTCGLDADCSVVNHYPICSCPPPLRGDPLLRCDATPDRKTCFIIDYCYYLNSY